MSRQRSRPESAGQRREEPMAISKCGTQTDFQNKELKQHGSTAFPIACYADDLSAEEVAWHWHEEWEIAVVKEGCPEFKVDNRRFSLPAGDGIFINTKALHAVKNSPREAGKLISAVFHPRLIGGNTDSIFWQQLVQPLMENASTGFLILRREVPWEHRVLEWFEESWNAISEESEDYEITVRHLLSKAARSLIRNSDFSATGMSAQELLTAERIRTMMEYIENHYAEDLNTEMIAAQISASSSVCLRCFHQMLSTTPMQYVKQLRIRKAAAMLTGTSRSAKDIALDCGFNDISYFTKSFREIYRCTPGAYRRAHRSTGPL